MFIQPVLLMKEGKTLLTLGVLVLSGLVFPLPAFALQTHIAPEGLYVHQIGHILFALAMLGFAVRIHGSQLYRKQCWKLMFAGAILFALWNCWAFCGHLLGLLVPRSDFLQDAGNLTSILLLRSSIDVLYYLFKFDHLLCIPALACIYFALRKMNNRCSTAKGGET